MKIFKYSTYIRDAPSTNELCILLKLKNFVLMLVLIMYFMSVELVRNYASNNLRKSLSFTIMEDFK